MSSEKSREREVHRYYQTWLESTAGLDASDHRTSPARFHLDGSPLKTSNDKALIAFAQLGCLRLNAKRGVVTLLGSSRQYILAEATKSLSLISDLTEDAEDDELWFGNASFPRSQGVSEGALDPPEYTAIGRNGKQYTAHALVINDLTKHEQYACHPLAGNGVTFYCGVPIVSKSGHHIGVYAVSDDKPREGVTPAELLFMQDMAEIVMGHFETIKNNVARFRGEKMVLGLSQFMRGKSCAVHQPEHSAPQSPISGGKSDRAAPVNENDITRQFRGMTITNADPSILRDVQTSKKSTRFEDAKSESHLVSGSKDASPVQSPERSGDSAPDLRNEPDPLLLEGSPGTPKPQISKPMENSTPSRAEQLEQVFTRAAIILRECATADGVVFFDAAPISLATGPQRAQHQGQQNELADNSSTSEDSASDSREYSSSGPSTDSDGSLQDRSRFLKAKGLKCNMLGYALDVSSSSTANINTIKTLGLTERSLKHFIRRYPHGKEFYFDANGDITSSEGDTSDPLRPTRSKTKTMDKLEAAIKLKSNSRSSKAIAEALIRVVPGARNVVWLPLWDFHKQRWCAGMFLWSRRPDRLLTAQDDMAYLKTFGSSIMIEVSRIDAHFADQAKATFIANISHELRSPLHGIFGSVEFLQDTALDAFQSSMAFGIETCAKTLLDTVEHVLDYAKINQKSAKFAKRSGSRGSGPDPSKSILEDELDLAELFEEVIEAVHAGSTFKRLEYVKSPSPLAETNASPNDTLQMTRDNVQRGSTHFTGTVRLILRVERQLNWWVRTQSGGIRRIIMNILGNALKYTDKGQILISLTTSEQKPNDTINRNVCITVKDTGRGMSANFLQNHAFTPFSQESQFSEGTGLGLSIVRQIVHSLNGRIDLKSTKGVGTKLQVIMPLPTVPNPPVQSGSSSVLSSVIEKTSGMTLCFLDPGLGNEPSEKTGSSDEPVQSSIRELAEQWFGMKTMRVASMDGVTTNFFVYAEPPPIEYLLNHHGQHSGGTEVPLIIMATNAFESASLAANGINRLTDLGRILEIISQPCGPQKFAKTIQRCLTRLQTLTNDPEKFSATNPVTLAVHEKANTASGLRHSRDLDISNSQSNYIEKPQTRLERKTSTGKDRSNLQPTRLELGGVKQNDGTEQTTSYTKKNSLVRRKLGPKSDPAPLSSDNQATTRPPVLLVDDNEINLNLLVAFMKKAGHPYVKAMDGTQAVEAFEKASTNPDTAFKYILMDISMPVMDGIEATRTIRQYEKKQETKEPATVITLTGLSFEATRKDMMDAGADYFLSKPVKFKELIELLRPEQDRN